MQKSPEELEELSQVEQGDAFLDHMLKKFDEHISKWWKDSLIHVTPHFEFYKFYSIFMIPKNSRNINNPGSNEPGS